MAAPFAAAEVFIHLNRPSKPAFQARRRSGRGVVACSKVAKAAIDWGRYAELYEYDADEPCIPQPRSAATHDRGTVAAPPLLTR
jgi:hypothetical protein